MDDIAVDIDDVMYAVVDDDYNAVLHDEMLGILYCDVEEVDYAVVVAWYSCRRS